MSRIALLVPALLSLVGSAAAADMTLDDLRLSGGWLSTQVKGGQDFSGSAGNGSASNASYSNPANGNAHSAYRGEIDYTGGHLGATGGFIYGADLAWNQLRFRVPGAQEVYNTPVVDIHLGYGIAPVAGWDFELSALGGFGWTYLRYTGSNTTSTSVNTHYFEYGAQLGTTYTFPGTALQIGFKIPYIAGYFHPSVSTSSNNGTGSLTASDNLRNVGFAYLFQVGLRL